MHRERTYLDHAAGSPLRPEAAAALTDALAQGYGNPGSPHREGQRARAALERARSQIAEVLDLPPRSVIFTGGGTEAARIGLVGAAWARGSPRVTCSALEHPAITAPAQLLAEQGLEVLPVPVDAGGIVDPDAFLGLCAEQGVAALLAIHHETGLAQPVAEIGVALQDRGCVLLCDAALAPGRVPLKPLLRAAPLVALSAHKFGGPAGVGLLVVAPGTTLKSPARGGIQEEQLRGGTPNVAGALATAMALQLAVEELEERSTSYSRFESTLRDTTESIIGWSFVGHSTRPTGIRCLAYEYAVGEALMMNMDLQGVAVSTGNSCTLGGTDPSPGLLAMGFDVERAAQTVRISFGWNTTDEDVKSLCECIRTTSETRGRFPTKPST